MSSLNETIQAAIRSMHLPKVRVETPIQVRDLANNRFSLRYKGPDVHRGGYLARSYPRIGTSDITKNNVTCLRIQRGEVVMDSAQMRLELFEDHTGYYTMARPNGQFYEGTFSTMTRKEEMIQFGGIKVYFESRGRAIQAFRHLKQLNVGGRKIVDLQEP